MTDRPVFTDPEPLPTAPEPVTPPGDAPPDRAPSQGRRALLVRAGAVWAAVAVGALAGRALLADGSGSNAATGGTGDAGGASASGSTARVAIPQAVDPVPTPGPDASLDVPGITPVVTPDAQFFRLDTRYFPPSVDVATWSLRVHGMVRKEVRLTFEDLVQLPLVEQYVTLACVSDEVGGNLVGNAKWTGARLADVLAMAGVQAGATQIVGRSVDGFTAGFPTAWITDPAHPREALIAVEMNDLPLPVDHGFPARLIVPGLYGYVSATKWLSEIELTTLEAFDAYWVPLGWAKEAPVLTQSRIDVPPNEASLTVGPVAVAGVAWAPDRGISKVEVSIDQDPWRPATLATEISPATWVQWTWAWQATPGRHTIEVRATDGTGVVQTDRVTPPVPDGARGHHTIVVHVG